MITSTDFNEMNAIVAYLRRVPFEVTRKKIYNAYELYAGYDPDDDSTFSDCYDTKTYQHFLATGKHALESKESIARALHDNGMHMALVNFFMEHKHTSCLGIMGGHALLRTDPMFKEITLLSKCLTEQDFTMLSGGGPGAMEATHLGAWMAERNSKEVQTAFEMLDIAPSFKDAGWLSSAFKTMQRFPQEKYVSLGIPTWLYGHEPSTPFATHIAKFFENSIREDSILTLAYGGIIYAPGSAGTMQEIFQEAVQNHYLSFGVSSPMIFLGTKFWTEEMPVYPLLKGLMESGKYKNLRLTLTDDTAEIVRILTDFREELRQMVASKQKE